MTFVSVEVVVAWLLWLAFLALAWSGGAAACELAGVPPGREATVAGACLVITIIAALAAISSRRT